MPNPLRTLRFQRLPHPAMRQPCIIPVNIAPNKKGYVQLKRRDSEARGKTENLHRIVYRSRKGPIPPGCEVDHICNRRACCNVKHLRCLQRLDHLRVTNLQRNAGRLEEARCFWEANRSSRHVTGAELGQRFNVSPTTGSRWIRAWKAEEAV